MSNKFLTKSPKHCAKHGFNLDKLPKRLLYGFSTILLSLFSFLLLVWLILRPSKPEFYLNEADIYQLNLLPPHLLNSSIRITLVSKNPNKKVGVYYDQLQVYASYKGQQITVYTSFPPFYQGHQDTNLLTASLLGVGLPVAPSLGYQVSRDQTAGRLILNLKVNGRLRWKVGTWVSARCRFNVDCVAIMAFGGSSSVVVPLPLPPPPLTLITSEQGSPCSSTL